ncbi:MAG: single-stranded-DNA-specific exonuclease RecJ [Candidatus Uhrbacteria bacterium]|nr:single-stranded-DNA-specific exonuclease RecJ [Candidatus Uhrbacteria bacterium]
MKRWMVQESVSPDVQRQFPEQGGVILQLLWNRGLRTQEEMDIFLGPDWSRDTFDPDLFLQMHRAVKRVYEALERGEVITIHGDYDADGTCGTAVLVITLREICRALRFVSLRAARGSEEPSLRVATSVEPGSRRGAEGDEAISSFDETKITTYIPHREKEGYGMSVDTIEHLSSHEETKLVITVDCGISNKPAIDRGAELGIDTIVCDHHTMPVELPTSAILIHPLVPGETFPNKHLCGTGVAFKLASALITEARRRIKEIQSRFSGVPDGVHAPVNFPEGHEKWLLDLVAIATVTDVMPLRGENRVLEKYGLLVLNKTRRKGIQKLLDVAGSTLGQLDTVSIGFQIGPRLNAAGRMTHASEALDLLIEEDDLRATTLAMRLHELNIERQKASQLMYEQAKRQIGETQDESLIVACQEGWGAGLVGLVAGKLVNDYNRPVLVVGQDGEKFVGSGRSIEGFDVTKALHHASAFLDKFGGHPQACGFSVTGIDRFKKAMAMMKEFAQEQMKPEDLEPRLSIDTEITLDGITWELFDALQAFHPFGTGNPVPLFVSRAVRVASFSTVGRDGGHLKLRLQSQTGKLVEAIGFGFGAWMQKLTLNVLIDVVYEIQVNEWNGNRQLQIRVVDLQLS